SICWGEYPPKGWAKYITGRSNLGNISIFMVCTARTPKKNIPVTSTRIVIGFLKADRIRFIPNYGQISVNHPLMLPLEARQTIHLLALQRGLYLLYSGQ